MPTRSSRHLAPQQHVLPVHRIVVDGMEDIRLGDQGLVLLHRGAIPLLRFLGHAYDGENVIALEVVLGTTRFEQVRKFDKGLELRLQAAWRKAMRDADIEVELPHVRLQVVTVSS